MSAPKSVVKYKKGKVEYTSSVDKCQYYLFELTRAALRDVGRFVCKKFKEEYYTRFNKKTGEAGKSIGYKVFSSKTTLYPRVQIGLKKTSVGFYSMFQEFGTSKQPKIGILQSVVESNIDEIVKIESQYLSALESEAHAQRLVDESEVEGDADD